MPLRLLQPPALVSVRDRNGSVLPALLLGIRDDRRYVQVSRGAGANHLTWVPAGAVEESGGVAGAEVLPASSPAPARRVPRSLR